MSTPKFTEGPWKVAGGDFCSRIIRSGLADDVAEARMIYHPAHYGYVPDSEQLDANAALIAAAPSLFEALEFYATGQEDFGALARSVLAKMEGGAQ